MRRLTLSVVILGAVIAALLGTQASPASAEPICLNIPPVPPVLTGPLEICIPL